MKNTLTLVLALLLAHTAAPALAQQQKPDEHAKHHAAAPATAAELTAGEVRKVDKEARKITIKHGEIKNLDMPPMTMVFQVKDAALLDKVKAGDAVRFAAEKDAAGAFVVTAIQAAK